MLDGASRHRYAGHRPQFAGPHAGGVHHRLAAHGAAVGRHLGHPPVFDGEPGDAGLHHHAGALVARALGQRLGQAGGVHMAVGRDVGGRQHPLDGHDGEQVSRLLRPDDMHLQAEALGHGGGALDLHETRLGTSEAQAAHLLPVHRLAGFRLQDVVERHASLQHPGHVARGTQLTDQARRMPRGAFGKPALLHHHHVRDAHAGQMIGDRTANNAAADDHHPSLRGKLRHQPSTRDPHAPRTPERPDHGVTH